MKRILALCFTLFISVLFIGTSYLFVYRACKLTKTDGIKPGIYSLWLVAKDVENKYTAELIGHDKFININGAFSRLTLSKMVPAVDSSKSVYKLRNGYITFIEEEFEEFDTKQKNNISKSAESARETGAELLYLAIPPKACSEEDFYDGVDNKFYEISEYRLKFFEQQGFDTVDLHKNLHEQGFEHYSLFYRTDHHWNADAGLWAAGEVSRWLVEKGFNVNTDTFNKYNYNKTVIENLFLGSSGKQVGIYYAGVDDFSYYEPKFSTNYYVSGIAEGFSKGGSFADTVFDKSKLTDDYMHSHIYSSFLGGDFALTKIENRLNKNGPKVLMIKDSFTNVISTYLSAECSELHLIDPRHYKESVSEYILKNGFDAVIVSLASTQANDIFDWE